MQGFQDWLLGLPPAALYAALAVVAALENIFPPIPADTVVALGSFIAARGEASALATFLATWTGNVAGAALMYGLGHRYGHAWLALRLVGAESSEHRLAEWYRRRGTWAIVVSRFLPGFRAVVPPVAGALRIPARHALTAIGLASAVWYGAISWAGYHVGDSWDAIAARISGWNRALGIVAAVVAAALVAAWLVYRRRRAGRASDAA